MSEIIYRRTEMKGASMRRMVRLTKYFGDEYSDPMIPDLYVIETWTAEPRNLTQEALFGASSDQAIETAVHVADMIFQEEPA